MLKSSGQLAFTGKTHKQLPQNPNVMSILDYAVPFNISSEKKV